eukprot:Rmarinus@m.4509
MYAAMKWISWSLRSMTFDEHFREAHQEQAMSPSHCQLFPHSLCLATTPLKHKHKANITNSRNNNSSIIRTLCFIPECKTGRTLVCEAKMGMLHPLRRWRGRGRENS